MSVATTQRMSTEELAQHLELIRSASGALTPEAVVAAASDHDHPLHHYFTWDDSDAAAQWRKQQARLLIHRVRIVVQRTTKSGVREVKVRGIASVVDPVTREREYRPVGEIQHDPVLSAQVLDAIRRDINALRRKYAAYGSMFDDALRLEADAA